MQYYSELTVDPWQTMLPKMRLQSLQDDRFQPSDTQNKLKTACHAYSTVQEIPPTHHAGEKQHGFKWDRYMMYAAGMGSRQGMWH